MKLILGYILLLVIFSQSANVNKNNKPRIREPGIHNFRVNRLTTFDVNKPATNVTTRVYGGSEAPEGKYKFMIFSMYCPEEDFQKGVFSCSGSLIQENWVLIAAHCFGENLHPSKNSVILAGGKADLSGYVRTRLRMGYYEDIADNDFGVQERRPSNIFVNDWYDVDTKEHDIALIKVQRPFDTQKTIKTVPLSYDKMRSHQSCTILGWGLSENNARTYMLMYADNVAVQTVEEGCIHKKEGDFICLTNNLGKGICHGDSGSPLYCDGKVWGVASHLVSYEDNPNCGEEIEEYYTQLHTNLAWVQEKLTTPIDPTDDEPITPPETKPNDGAKTASNFPIIIIFITILTKFTFSKNSYL